MIFWLNGQPWHVQRVGRDSPALVDRTGQRRLATTDPRTRLICVSEAVTRPQLEHVLTHEAAHACMVSYGLLNEVRGFASDHVRAEEWACNLIADHAAEVLAVTASMLKRW